MHFLKGHFNENALGWLYLLLLALCLVALHLFVLHRQDFADDLYFSTALDQRSLWEFLSFRYSNWTGRIPIEFMLVLVAQHVWLWKVLNILAFTFLVYSIAALTDSNVSATVPKMVLVAFLILFITPDVLWWSAWWLTGSVNYLWPAAAGALALSIYFNSKSPQLWRLVLAFICGAFAAYSEQVGVLLFFIVTVSLVWRFLNGSTRPWHYVLALVIGLNLFIALSAPGNASRFVAEQATWFPDFSTMGWEDKLNIGLGLVVKNLLASGNWLILLASCAAIIAVINSKFHLMIRLLVMPGLIWLTLNHFSLILEYHPSWLYSVPLSEASVARPIAFAVMIVSMYSLACLVWATGFALLVNSDSRRLMLAFALLAGAGTLILVGWSPTSTASGSRTAFVFMMVAVAVTADLLQRLGEDNKRFCRYSYLALYSAVVIGALTRLYGLF